MRINFETCIVVLVSIICWHGAARGESLPKLDNPMSAAYLQKNLRAGSPRLILTPEIEANLREKLKSDHCREYGRYYSRVSLDLGETDDRPTDEILKACADPAKCVSELLLVRHATPLRRHRPQLDERPHRDVEAAVHEAAQDVALRAEVVGDAAVSSLRLRGFRHLPFHGSRSFPAVRVAAGHLRHEVLVVEPGRLAGLADE